MKTFFLLPDLFRAEGGIARIMRCYLRAAGQLAGPEDEVSYLTLMDRGENHAQARALVGPALRTAENCANRYPQFVLQAIDRAMVADRVICAHLHHLVLVWVASLLRPGLRYYLVAHGIEVWRPYRFWERFALLRATRILCVSEYTRRQMLRFLPALDPARVVVVHNTFDPSLAGASATAKSARPKSGARILAVSRLLATDPYKGIDLMIEAMPRILRELPDAELRIVGGGDDQARLEALAKRLGLNQAVRFLGIVDDATLRGEYAACDMFALPSRKEGFGLVYLEAMAWGKPCLAARAGGAPEIVGDPTAGVGFGPLGTSGLTSVGALVEYGNVEDIAVNTCAILRHSYSPERIRQRAEDFSFPRFVARLEEALR